MSWTQRFTQHILENSPAQARSVRPHWRVLRVGRTTVGPASDVAALVREAVGSEESFDLVFDTRAEAGEAAVRMAAKVAEADGACTRGDSQRLTELLHAEGVSPSAVHSDGWPLIVTTAYSPKRKACMELLIAAKADLDLQIPATGETAVFIAVGYDNVACLERLLVAGACPDKADNNGSTPASMACQYGNEPALALLIEHRADLDRPRALLPLSTAEPK